MDDESDVTPMRDLVRSKRNATISVNGGPEIPVRVVKHADGGATLEEIHRSPISRRRLPAKGIEMTQTFDLAPSGYEWLVRLALGEFNG